MLDIILDALLDTIKIVPILLFVYLFIAFLTHHKDEPFTLITGKKKWFGPLFGSLLGSIPQCGFSAAMADLYTQKKITLGTLFAVFIATSDEAIPILIANPSAYKEMFILIGFKLLFALFFGYLIDILFNKKVYENIKSRFTKNKQTEKHEHSCSCHSHNHEHEHEHQEAHCTHDHCCADNIFMDAIIHTLKISGFILLFNLIFGTLIYFISMEKFLSIISINPYLQPLITAIIGLIPNCAGSIFLVEVFLEGGISLAATIGGLSAGSGIGILILFRKSKNIKENILILISLYLIGVLIGLALTPLLA